MHSCMYGMYALQESVRQMRGIAPAQIPGANGLTFHCQAGFTGERMDNPTDNEMSVGFHAGRYRHKSDPSRRQCRLDAVRVMCWAGHRAMILP